MLQQEEDIDEKQSYIYFDKNDEDKGIDIEELQYPRIWEINRVSKNERFLSRKGIEEFDLDWWICFLIWFP
ncbi:hypothetical protein JTE90_006544 [Oedothorax gibbosus]|uniref:Uncharacterized protein n=1 Tax=Oedothorax gibbosus TaxID=931172 RepID=A0AAV6VIT4_9ARAC|nr:hypothetical protein JTE90_006544 [Oedothorax gibbosus]